MKLKALCKLSREGGTLAPGDEFERGYAAPVAPAKKAKKKAKADEE